MTTTRMTLRQALKRASEDLAADNVSYLSGPREYVCDKGILYVRNAPSSDGGQLLGVFEAELCDARGRTVRKYKV